MVTNVDERSPPMAIATQRKWFLIVLAIIIVSVILTQFYRLYASGFETAQAAMERRDFPTARTAIERYLRIHPGHAEARLLAGSAYFLDDALPPLQAADNAIRHFSQIPDTSSSGSQARSLEARATFLVRQEPTRAERLLRRAIELNRDQFDAYYLLWQLYNMTERYFDCESIFREVYRLCPPEQRAFRLREWYSSQFTPLNSASQLDFYMGFRKEQEVPTDEIALQRLQSFLNHEPESPELAAALAQWYMRNQSREAAVQILDAVPHREEARKNQFFHATYIETLIDVGHNDRAAEEFAKWQGPRQDYQYYRVAGIHAQEILGDAQEAARLLRQASEIWPGPADWPLLTRLARSLALSGNKEEAQKVQLEAKRIEGLSDLKFHQKARSALANLNDPAGLEEVVHFYEEFHRSWEAEAWRSVISELKKTSTVQHEIFQPN